MRVLGLLACRGRTFWSEARHSAVPTDVSAQLIQTEKRCIAARQRRGRAVDRHVSHGHLEEEPGVYWALRRLPRRALQERLGPRGDLLGNGQPPPEGLSSVGNSHGTAWRPCRRYAEKSALSTVQILQRAVSSVIRTRHASAKSIDRSVYFRHNSKRRGISEAKSNAGSRMRSPRARRPRTSTGEPSTHAVSRTTASQVWNGAWRRSASAAHA